ncbi:hypothetical protein Sru01_57840 [Sphaerisporangium rufum]|uniref:N(4)-bis(aminopropyl)spermidine synthase C-terminal domain-containing protein n=1 Tax=Sphaerisporangium rufum TaxID=1381558 RepID=A0A919V3G7_9ACTN|nr:bis-aminopropyl spermidine synthase family protein [Sphaerisporangium rufum]GII80802.1 hypothetical protein Sru01_57840 [Sphaerisporangium rufum]
MELDGLGRLLSGAGVDARRYRTALALLCDGAWWTVADLVRESATSRRGVEALLREAGPERSGERYRLGAARAAACRALLGADETPTGGTGADETGAGGASKGGAGAAGDLPADPVAHLLPRHAGVLERVAELIAGAPRGRQALDHVSATAETVVRRALLLGARFWLPGATLLCVGDHDLTSLAVAMLHPGVQVIVVDVDERILAYIDERAGELGLPVRTRWADLRLGLPPSAHGRADLAFTDPPYTPEGVGLFAARAVEGLADPDQGRLLVAYGASERTPMLALKVQGALHELNLAIEAMYPDFNRYHGAEAIGSAADLYVLRPTSKTRPAVAARVERFRAAIYTHGPHAVEAGAAAPSGPPPGEDGFAPDLLVGDWPKEAAPRVPRVRLSTWLARPYAAAADRVAVAVPPGPAGALPRLLLATRAGHVRAYLPGPGEPGEHGGLGGPLEAVYRTTVTGAVVDAERRPVPEDPAGRLLRGILDNAHGKLANGWREGLVRATGTLTKRQARAVVAEVAPWADDVTVLELPGHRLHALPAAVAASLRLGGGPGG